VSTDSCKHLLRVGIAETAFIASRYGGAESGEENYVMGVSLEDVFQPSLDLSHHGGRSRNLKLDEVCMITEYFQ